MPSVIRDLPNGNEPYEVRPPEYEYPFLNQGDPWSFIVTRYYKQTITGYNADRLASKYLPGVEQDRVHNEAYMVNESVPSRTSTAMVAFTRSFARVPRQQVIPSSMYVTKPPITGTLPQNIGASVVIQPDTTVAQYNIYDRIEATSDSGLPTISYPTGGTYTITVAGDTTAAIAYNASAATVKTALELLTSVSERGGVDVTGTYNSVAGFTIALKQWGVSPVTETFDISGLTVTPGTFKTGGASFISYDTCSYRCNTANPDTFTGGNFTASLFGQTTAAIAYNASTATVQAAFNALSGFSATIAIPTTGAYTKPLSNDASSIDFYATVALATASATSSLTPTGSTVTLAASTTAPTYAYTVTFSTGALNTRTVITTTAHGITAADDIYVKQGTTYREIDTGSFSVISTTGITFTSASGAVFSSTDTITEIGRLNSTYAAGAKLTRIKRVTDFYLPAVTPGIATADDIPLPTYQGDPATLLEAIFANETDINYEVGELGRWRDTPILSRTTTTINAATL